MHTLRAIAKRLPYPLLVRVYHHWRYRQESDRAARASESTGLPLLDALDIQRSRKSDTLFVLGSASSINQISDEKWKIIRRHDSIGINLWPVHPFVPDFYHFENVTYEHQPALFHAFQELFKRRSDAYANTIKIITEIHASRQPQIVSVITGGMKENLYIGFSLPVIARNENELQDGLRYMQRLRVFSRQQRVAWLFKYGGSVTAMMALALIMGYRRIVLCGVDLNQQEYFYQNADLYPECAGWEFAPREQNHLTTRRLPWLVPAQSAVYLFKEMILDPAAIELFVESTASTLYPRVPLASPELFHELAGTILPAEARQP